MVVTADNRGDESVQWTAAARSGVIAGILYLAVEMLFTLVFLGGSGWAPLQRIAAILLGPRALSPLGRDMVPITLAALGIHLALALCYTALIAAAIHRMGPTAAVMAGAMAGLLLYTVNYYFVFTALFPWFVSGRTWVTVFAHLVFGFVVALSYKAEQLRTITSGGRALR